MNLLSCYKSINKHIGLFLSDLYSFLKYYVFRRGYKRYMKLNSIPNKRVEKEEEYKRKWRVLGRVDPIYYRYYSSFVGNDPNLVPVDLSANIIEPILNPVQYRPYYSDKNMFDKIVPNVSAKTLLRKSNGMYLTNDYLRIHELTDSYLSEVCSDYTRIVVKPAKETSGGEGIVANQGLLFAGKIPQAVTQLRLLPLQKRRLDHCSIWKTQLNFFHTMPSKQDKSFGEPACFRANRLYCYKYRGILNGLAAPQQSEEICFSD